MKQYFVQVNDFYQFGKYKEIWPRIWLNFGNGLGITISFFLFCLVNDRFSIQFNICLYVGTKKISKNDSTKQQTVRLCTENFFFLRKQILPKCINILDVGTLNTSPRARYIQIKTATELLKNFEGKKKHFFLQHTH